MKGLFVFALGALAYYGISLGVTAAAVGLVGMFTSIQVPLAAIAVIPLAAVGITMATNAVATSVIEMIKRAISKMNGSD